MKVFVSWSGSQSRETAEKLSEWLKSLFQQSIEVFVSSKDIEKGDRWADRLAAALQDYDFGIVILNHANKDRLWVAFEAGALSKKVTKSRLVPLLCGLTPGDLLESPLGQFQGVEANKEGLFELAKTINHNLEKSIDSNPLLEALDVWWEKKGKPVTEFGDVKGGNSKKETPPTLRDVIARIDKTETMLADLIRMSVEQSAIREARQWVDVDRHISADRIVAGRVGLPTFDQLTKSQEDDFLKIIEQINQQKTKK